MTNRRTVVTAPSLPRGKRGGGAGPAILTITKLSVIAEINGYREKPILIPISLVRWPAIDGRGIGCTTGHRLIIPTPLRNTTLPRQQRNDDQECNG